MPTIQEQLSALLNPLVSGGVYPLTAEQGAAPPYAIYQRVAGSVENNLAGNGSPPISNTRFQIDVWAFRYSEAQAAAAAIRAAMLAWAVQNVLLSEHDEYETDVRMFRVILEFSVWHY